MTQFRGKILSSPPSLRDAGSYRNMASIPLLALQCPDPLPFDSHLPPISFREQRAGSMRFGASEMVARTFPL